MLFSVSFYVKYCSAVGIVYCCEICINICNCAYFMHMESEQTQASIMRQRVISAHPAAVLDSA